MIRIGIVTNVFANENAVRVMYEDTGSYSLKLPVINNNMPENGEKVLVAHCTNGSSKGIVVGAYSGKQKDEDDKTEEIITRLERIEESLGLPHTV